MNIRGFFRLRIKCSRFELRCPIRLNRCCPRYPRSCTCHRNFVIWRLVSHEERGTASSPLPPSVHQTLLYLRILPSRAVMLTSDVVTALSVWFRVTQRRREKLAASEGRSLPGQGRAAKGRGKKKSNATEGGGGQVLCGLDSRASLKQAFASKSSCGFSVDRRFGCGIPQALNNSRYTCIPVL